MNIKPVEVEVEIKAIMPQKLIKNRHKTFSFKNTILEKNIGTKVTENEIEIRSTDSYSQSLRESKDKLTVKRSDEPSQLEVEVEELKDMKKKPVFNIGALSLTKV